MNVQKANGSPSAAGIGAVLILAGVLAVLFWRSFLPEFVHFSNDGPLGQQAAAFARLPAGYLGIWVDNNDLGGNGGSLPFGIYSLFSCLVGPIGYAKFLAPFDLFILGLGAWVFFRQLKLSPLAATLGALAAALNSTFFATACWGVAPQEGAVGMDFFAMALVISITAETPLLISLARLALAGLCVGENVIEASDIGAIFSLCVSAFILFNALNQEKGPIPARIGRGVGQVMLVAIFAVFIATQALVTLIGTEIQGISGTSQDAETKAAHWDWATQWSLPKTETLGLFVPGLFGYKMDTPQNMDVNFKDYYDGGNYWGAMGRDPNWDRYFASGSKGDAPQGYLRQTGGGNYAGILVVLVAVWGAAQSLRKRDSVFSDRQRRQVWFWSAVVILSVLFAWGRYSFFYALFYKLPYVSTIRNPTKFIIVFSWSIVVLFAYGIDGLSRRHLARTSGAALNPAAQLKKWWATAAGFDRKWTWGCVAAVALSLLGWLVYGVEKPALIRDLQILGFPGTLGETIATFSLHQAGCFVVLLAIATGLTILIISGVFAGRRSKFGGLLLGLFLLVDLGRANLPYINHWDYKQKYDISPANIAQSTNPILNLLRDKYYDHRVCELPFSPPEGMDSFHQLYTIEWMQHQFPYYNIQSLEVWQRPRVAADIAAYEQAVYFHGTPDSLLRQWQLTNTRYILGPAGFIEPLNTQIDPVLHRFRIIERFGIAPKPGVSQPTQYSEVTAVPAENGDFALFEFTGALPRAKLYSKWLVNTNDQATLKTLARPDFDPGQTLLISTPQPGLAPVATNNNSGSVEFKNYTSTKTSFSANTPTAAVMLWNDKFDPQWKVTVDGRPAPLLRCNFIMRGVYLTPGSHVIEFKFTVPHKPLYITMSGFGAAILLGGFLLVAGRGKPGQGSDR